MLSQLKDVGLSSFGMAIKTAANYKRLRWAGVSITRRPTPAELGHKTYAKCVSPAQQPRSRNKPNQNKTQHSGLILLQLVYRYIPVTERYRANTVRLMMNLITDAFQLRNTKSEQERTTEWKHKLPINFFFLLGFINIKSRWICRKRLNIQEKLLNGLKVRVAIIALFITFVGFH